MRTQGGSSAVKCWGSGALDGVRCIPIGSHMYFWFRVASGAPPAQLAASMVVETSVPGVCGNAAELDEAAVSWRLSAVGKAADLSEADAELILDEKAKAWQFAHHSGSAAPSVHTPALLSRPAKRTRMD